jgi:sugar lactone lactonase YvrE
VSSSSVDEFQAEVALRANAELGEGPWWDELSAELLWVDIDDRRIHRYRPEDHSTTSLELPGRVGAVVRKVSGGLVVAMERSFATVEADGRVSVIAELEADLPTRMNDGKCDRLGRFYAGTMALDEESKIGSLYRLDPDGAVERLVTGVAVSNGLDWNEEGDTMYYVDSNEGSIDAFDFDETTGRVENRRPLVTVPEGDAIPDGLTVDRAGGIWVAFWGGHVVRHYSPTGELEGVVHVPAGQVTSCAFGGADLGDLYITSARVGLSPLGLTADPTAGALFRARTGATGRLPNLFAG